MNIHSIITGSLNYLNKEIDIKLIIGNDVVFDDYGNPVYTVSPVMVKARMQSLTPQELSQMGNANLIDYEYVKFYIGDVLEAKAMKNKAFDFVVYNSEKYKIVINENWKQNNWQCIYAYKVKEEDTT
ncbi:MAG: hypothetical protein LBH46_03865 [Rickettsiales bacterium]|jgi:hypothetical protein|nr:hypothetical protein [Rickettsiales bacterium]